MEKQRDKAAKRVQRKLNREASAAAPDSVSTDELENPSDESESSEPAE
jgi:hypothetical protein